MNSPRSLFSILTLATAAIGLSALVRELPPHPKRMTYTTYAHLDADDILDAITVSRTGANVVVSTYLDDTLNPHFVTAFTMNDEYDIKVRVIQGREDKAELTLKYGPQTRIYRSDGMGNLALSR